VLEAGKDQVERRKLTYHHEKKFNEKKIVYGADGVFETGKKTSNLQPK